MAQRFGGRFSQAPGTETPPPTGPAPTAAARPRPDLAERRSRWLLLFALPFAIKAFWQDPAGLARNLAAFALIALAAWLTREGARAAAAHAARATARRPAFPRKIIGSLAIGAGLGLGALGTGPAAALLLGLIGAVLHLAAFGPDPMRDKGMDGIDTVQQNRARRMLAEGEAHLTAMAEAAGRTHDRQITARVERFAVTARALFRTVEDDPRDLTAARRYLGVYLIGARDATIKFADLWRQGHDPAVRADYEALLHDLETDFAARTAALLDDNRSDLDVEIAVLRDRLKREGLHLQQPSPPSKRGE